MPAQVGDETLGSRVSNGVGRSAHFGAGYSAVRQPQARPITPMAFHPSSVLHQMLPSGVGFSERDQGRFLYGGGALPSLPTAIGQSDQTYSKAIWLGRGLRAPAVDIPGGGGDF